MNRTSSSTTTAAAAAAAAKRLAVLVVDESASGALQTKRALELAGHEATMTTFSATDYSKTLESRKWDAIVTEWVRQRPGTAELIASVRERDEAAGVAMKSPTWIVVLTHKPVESTIDAAFAAGADDFVRKPIIKEELCARVAGVIRAAAKRDKAFADQSSRVNTSPYAGMACWTSFEGKASTCIAQMLERKMKKLVLAEMKGFNPVNASSILLSLPEKATEFRLIIEIERTALEDIGRSVYGETSPGVLIDLLYEMANTVGGTFMRAGIDENVELTTSLPSTFATNEIRATLENADARTSLYLEDPSGGRLAVHLTVRERRNVFVPVSKLREGMVLARDLMSGPSGALLLKAGTRITSSASQRVATILGGDVTVEVADAA
jgi:DNA-binding response OmpR family regulator